MQEEGDCLVSEFWLPSFYLAAGLYMPPKVKPAFEAYSKYFWGSPLRSRKLKTTCLKLQGNPFWNEMNVHTFSSTYIVMKE
jgi:hypothetical protein